MTAMDSIWLGRGCVVLGADPELPGTVEDMPNEAEGAAGCRADKLIFEGNIGCAREERVEWRRRRKLDQTGTAGS